MIRLILNAEQSELLKHATEVVEVADSTGSVLAQAWPLTRDDDISLDEMRRMKEATKNTTRRWTTQQVLEHLKRREPSPCQPI